MAKSNKKNIIEVAGEVLPEEGKGKIEEAQNMALAYIDKEVIADFSKVPQYAKLTVLQKTPKRYIKERDVGGKPYHYVDHQFAKKCLNMVFNFRVSNEVIKEEYHEYEEPYKEKQKDGTYKNSARHVTEAECTMKFTFEDENGKQIVRTVHSSHKGYENKATTRGDVMQSAFSKAWTKVAATFGIGSELEEDLYQTRKKKEEDNEDVINAEPEAPSKSFLTEELPYFNN